MASDDRTNGRSDNRVSHVLYYSLPTAFSLLLDMSKAVQLRALSKGILYDGIIRSHTIDRISRNVNT
jgi:hypothetical protein